MKLLLAALLLFLVACNEPVENPSAVNLPLRRDTNIVRRERANPYSTVDVSPMDISYFPPDYPVLKMSDSISGPPVARVIYSRPHKQGRKIFGSLLNYGQPWRLGANEATEIEFFQNVTIQGKRVDKGRYIMYGIPYEDRWKIVLNSNLFTWGLREDPSKDVYTFEIPVQHTESDIEHFTIAFQTAEKGADLVIAWGDVVAKLPITIR